MNLAEVLNGTFLICSNVSVNNKTGNLVWQQYRHSDTGVNL